MGGEAAKPITSPETLPPHGAKASWGYRLAQQIRYLAAYLSLPLVATFGALDALADDRRGWFVDAGADLRFRHDWFDNLPNGAGKVDPQADSYYRLRSRVWAEVGAGRWSLYGRLANEFRGYDSGSRKNEFPDELFVDNLYLEGKGLCDGALTLRLGRQDLEYGAERIISDGMGSDGSRAGYFDALLLQWQVTETVRGDFFGIWSVATDHLLQWGTPVYYANSYSGQSVDTDMTEQGVGTYWTIDSDPALPTELYAIWKRESRWYRKGRHEERIPGRSFTTLGFRLTPRLSEKLSGEVELATQLGQTEDSRSIFAYLAYGKLAWQEPHWWGAPSLGGATLLLSGDETSSAYDNPSASSNVTGWTPVFNRSTYLGELPVKMYGSSYRWSNLIWPHAEVTLKPFEGQRLVLQTGPMFAERCDLTEGNSLYRGWYSFLAYRFELLKPLARGRGAVTGAVQVEQMTYGDYYQPADAPNQGYFIRLELAVSY